MMVKHIDADAGHRRDRVAQSDPMERPEVSQRRRASPHRRPMPSGSSNFIDEQATDYVRVEELVPPKKNSETHALHIKRVLDHVDVNGISTKRYKVVLDSVERRRMRRDRDAAEQARLPARSSQCHARRPIPPRARADRGESHRPRRRGEAPAGRRRFRAGPGCRSPGHHRRERRLHRRGIFAGTVREVDPEQEARRCDRGESLDQPHARRHRRRDRRTRHPHARRRGQRRAGDAAGERHHRRRRQRRRDRSAHRPRPRQPRRHGLRPAAHGRDRQDASASSSPRFRSTRSSRPNSNAAAKTPTAPSRRSRRSSPTKRSTRRTASASTGPTAWVHARPSNTEPIMRIIAEAPDRAEAQQRIDQVQAVVNKAL